MSPPISRTFVPASTVSGNVDSRRPTVAVRSTITTAPASRAWCAGDPRGLTC
jgi:hypothetical protein